MRKVSIIPFALSDVFEFLPSLYYQDRSEPLEYEPRGSEVWALGVKWLCLGVELRVARG